MIRVDPGAQQTDAFQESRNLLLSKRAHADAIPGLEIEANDVRCTHAAAVAQVDPEQLHYLRSRGLGEAEAKRVIIEGFLEALVERLAEGPSGSRFQRPRSAVWGRFWALRSNQTDRVSTIRAWKCPTRGGVSSDGNRVLQRKEAREGHR